MVPEIWSVQWHRSSLVLEYLSKIVWFSQLNKDKALLLSSQSYFHMPQRRWIWPMLLVSVFIFTLSLRQLSDPDLGFHLKYGRWIVTNLQIPVTDQSTYTVAQHPYTDLHWLFQVILYGVFKLSGYDGISLFVCFLSLTLSLL